MATEVDRLVVVFDANFKALDDKLNKVIQKNQQAAAKVNKSWAGTGGNALTKGFDDLAKTAGEAARAIPGVGSALGALGPAGIAAAVGIAAVVEAFRGAREAAKFADDINDTANRLHISTDALQEWREALRLAGGHEQDADEALQSFNDQLGKAEAGLPKALRAFRELFGKGFTAADVTRLGGATNAIKKIQAAIQGLNTEQQDAILSQFGLGGMRDLLEKPSDDMEQLLADTHKLGLVMDAELVRKGGDLNDEFETLHKAIDIELKGALIDLGPVLLDLLTKMKRLVDVAVDLADAFKPIQDRSTAAMIRARDELNTRLYADPGKGGDPVRYLMPGKRAGDVKRLAELNAQIADKQAAELAAEMDEQMFGKHHGATKSLADTSKAPKEKKDQTLAFDKEAEDAYLSALKDLSDASAALATTLEEREAFEKEAVDAALAKKLKDLDIEKAKIIEAANKLGTDKNSQEQLQKLADAKAYAEQAAFEQKLAIQRAAEAAQLERKQALDQAQTDLAAQALAADAAHIAAVGELALTAKDRSAAEIKALAEQQQADRLLADATITRARETLKAAEKIDPDSDASKSARAALAKAVQDRDILGVRQGDETAAKLKSLQDPVQNYRDSLVDLSTTMAEAGVTAAKSLSDGLAEAAVNAESLGDVASSVFKQLIQQILSAEIQKNIAGPILSALGLPIPHYAAGTNWAAPGLAVVGEHGPELKVMKGGEKIIPNSALRNVGIGGGTSASPTIIFDNRGAVIWEQAARQLMAYADRAALGAGGVAVGAARRATPTDLARSASRRLG